MKVSLPLFAYCLIQAFAFVSHAARSSALNDTQVLLTRTLSSINSALSFFNKEHRNVNLDTVIGTRILEGQFKVLLDMIGRSPGEWQVDSNTLLDIERLQQTAGRISDKAIPYIATLTPRYFYKIGMMLQKGFWELDYNSKSFDDSMTLWPYKVGEALHEEDSDNCIAEFFGTGKRTKKTCTISRRCWESMTSPLYNGYSLSHEIFYLQIGRQFGCGAEMEMMRLAAGQESIEKLQDDFCANMMNEATIIAKEGFPERKQDLFMEQAALCGMLGYRQFFTSDWLEKILSWQDQTTGCYKGNPVRETDVEYRGTKPRIRNKREERLLDHGCLCHRTTVAVAALGQYIRYMLEFAAFERDMDN
ncbi:UPF0764 protein C16orf89 homolog [Pecten maximus]|uniref:UPF0764 protein C16orf89 homolog n=1 Tax=Pecten maximus TaxID=6579 RepID=UPI0014583134|nr:UPF0764 protein C16orf89 homolog [Pecten maximus]